MSFFYNEARKEPKAKPRHSNNRHEIPIQSLNQLGCSVCPREKDGHRRKTPKMEPTGAVAPDIYLLGTGPNHEEDAKGDHWSGAGGSMILSKFSRPMRRNMRFGHLTQCVPPQSTDGKTDLKIDVVEMECCRPRVIADIEESRPIVIVGVGDIPIRWITGLGGNKASALTLRGRLMPVKVGRHICWFYSIMWPNFINRKQNYGKSEYELALEHDVAWIEEAINRNQLELAEDYYCAGPYDEGIELITGQEAGDMQRLERALADLADEPKSSLDIETNALRVYQPESPKIWTAAVGTFERTVAFAIDHPDGWGSESRMGKVRDLFGEYMLYSGEKTCHNLAFEMEWLAHLYWEKLLRLTEWNDSMSMAHTFDERPGTKGLDMQTLLNFGFLLKSQSRVDVSRPKWIEEFPIREVLRYNGMDTKWSDRLRDTYQERFERDPDPRQLQEHERKVRLAPTLVLTEARGIPVDLDFAARYQAEIQAKVKALDEQIRRQLVIKTYEARYGTFSPSNDDHVLKLMRDILQRPEIKSEDRDGNVRWSTDEEALSAMPKAEVPIAPMLLERRGLQKLDSTYMGPLVTGKMLSADGLIHCKYSSMTAVTGRLAADDPAVQNWPVRKFKKIREAIAAERRMWMLAADYGQIEFRVMGMASEDRNLVKYCWTGYDVHGYWAGRMVDEYPEIKDQIVAEFGIDWDEKGAKTLRQESKNGWVFPMFFGSSTKSCADRLQLPLDVAEKLAAEFWDEFPGMKRWQEKLLKGYERNLYVETLTGRRRSGPMTKNQIINAPIQGTAFDIVGGGMNAISELAMETDDIELQTSLQIHDDLSSFISDASLESKMLIIGTEMCRHRFDWINVPLVVEMKVGQNWAALEEVAVYRSDELFNLRNPYK